MKIKFNHGADKVIDTSLGKTPFSDIFVIGAMHLCKEQEYIQENDTTYCISTYPTNDEGLSSVNSKSTELLEVLHSTIGSIGTLMAYADKGVVEEEIMTISWLIVGLSELAEMVSSANGEMDHSELEKLKRELKI